MNEQKKFPWVWVLIIVLVLVLGAGAYYWFFLKKTPQNPTDSAKTTTDSNQYNWSTMDDGPYNDKISYATSTDLVNWTDQKTILAEHASVPDVLLKDSTLYVYFVDVSYDGVKEQIGLLKSTDQGKTWGEKQIINIKGLGNKAAVDPTPILLDDGRLRLYYLDLNATRTADRSQALENNTIYSAISTDGTNFTEESAVFKYKGIFDPSVVKVADVWHLYVGTDDQKVLSATSSDGTKFEYEGVAVTGGAIPDVYFDGTKYWLFTGNMEIYTSLDGKTFTKTGNRFDAGKLTADPGVAKLADNSYLMVYKTSDKKPGGSKERPTK